jgi:hypothetical protein
MPDADRFHAELVDQTARLADAAHPADPAQPVRPVRASPRA